MQSALGADDLRSEVLQQLRSQRSDVSRPHRFDFYLYFPSEADAKAASLRLMEEGLSVEVRRAAKGQDWLCFAKATLVPDTLKLSELGSLFAHLALSYKGEFDGWEAEIVK